MAKLRNLKIENEALAGVNVADAAEISIVITSTEPDGENKSTLAAAVTAEGNTGLSYAWYKDNTPIGDDASSIEVEVGDEEASDEEASYKCTVTATYDDGGDKSKDSNVIKLKKADSTDPAPGGSTETKIGNRTLSEHLRMRLLGYI